MIQNSRVDHMKLLVAQYTRRYQEIHNQWDDVRTIVGKCVLQYVPDLESCYKFSGIEKGR